MYRTDKHLLFGVLLTALVWATACAPSGDDDSGTNNSNNSGTNNSNNSNNNAPAEVCDDGSDNDGDGDADCDDSDCVDAANCQMPDPEVCGDGNDNDGDGDTDCADTDCADDAACQIDLDPEVCDDESDNDGDGDVDCADSDCANAANCQMPDPEICDDGSDNDGDGDADCADSDCANAANCQMPDPEICDDGNDNDGDGDADCADSDCVDDPACQVNPDPEVCDDGTDNDGDGDADCADSDCADAANCQMPDPEICDDGNDNDGDGDADCADSDCADAANCQPLDPEVCDDGVDNNGDGAIDCNDAGCEMTALCLAILADTPPNGSLSSFAGLSLNEQSPQWDRLDEACMGGGAADHYYSSIAMTNRTGGTQVLRLDGDWSNSDGFFDGFLHVFEAPYDINTPVGCLRGNDDNATTMTSALSDVIIEPGQTLLFILSSFEPETTSEGHDFFVAARTAEICDDGTDNDNDGEFDCDDVDCVNAANCQSEPEICDDNIDNDGDGDTDCMDNNCIQDPHCLEVGPDNCGDGIDNDNNGVTDCAELSCAGLPSCASVSGLVGTDADLFALNGSINGDLQWRRRRNTCGVVRTTPTSNFSTVEISNQTNQHRLVHVEALFSVSGGFLHAFEDPYRLDYRLNSEDGCLGGDDGDGEDSSELSNLYMAPGESLTFVLSVDEDEDDANFSVLHTSTFAPLEDCSDGVDNNFNGDTDCNDVYCAGNLICTPTPVEVPLLDQSITLTGSIEPGVHWNRPNEGCENPLRNGQRLGSGYYFDTITLQNTSLLPRTLNITALWPEDHDGYLHVFNIPYDLRSYAGCQNGDDDYAYQGAPSTQASRLTNVEIAPFQRLVVVASTFDPNVTIDAYDLIIEAVPFQP